MRLIHAESMTLMSFSETQVPSYAILSHTWEEDEVTLQDFVHPDQSVRSRLKGFRKIQKTCDLARTHEIDYVWIDTCCIDKTSSAELSEAINSMFHWYREAKVCYAWLADLASLEVDVGSDGQGYPTWRACRWFTRGWTLQELIAPRVMIFYDEAWHSRGTKSQLRDALAAVTGIDGAVLDDPGTLYHFPVAQRMSWAASRQTTRAEDMAYCLLGLFDINMPMLYGEGGPRAFLRLQEHIVREMNDLSIFAWCSAADRQAHHGILATEVADFRSSSDIRTDEATSFHSEFAITNKGLHINDAMVKTIFHQGGDYIMKLNCVRILPDDSRQRLGIYLSQHPGGIYSRTAASGYADVDGDDTAYETRNVSIFKRVGPAQAVDLHRSRDGAIFLRRNFRMVGDTTPASPGFPLEAATPWPSRDWDVRWRMFLTRGSSNFAGNITLQWPSTPPGDADVGADIFPGQWVKIFVGKEDGHGPWAFIVSMTGNAELLGATDNMRILAIRARQRRLPMKTTVEGMVKDANGIPTGMRPVGEISVTLEPDVLMHGVKVHCIDVDYTPLSA